jgi:thiol:disulfide interchange protein
VGSFGGIFFMALTLVIVSFSCTGPIVGPLLVLAGKGGIAGPALGMFGFSFGLALPFALFAIFPGMLNKMAQSGGWLNQVKVVLGFIELMLALKFFSNADLAQGWRLLDREIFIALWIVLSFPTRLLPVG